MPDHTVMPTAPVTALIAEDEPLLAQALQTELGLAWPALQVLACVGDGHSAVKKALALQPDILFFDIRMPALSGLEAAAELLDLWPTAPPAKPFPQLVFVTAYDHYAVQAFEAHAIDYLCKPVQAERLQKTVLRLQQHRANRAASQGVGSNGGESAIEATCTQLRNLIDQNPATPTATKPAKPGLQRIQASRGNTVYVVPLTEVVYFEAADKYVRVMTASAEYLIRTPVRELLTQLDSQEFWQIHRSTVVRAGEVQSVQRDDCGKLTLSLRSREEKLAVSRLYAHHFRAM